MVCLPWHVVHLVQHSEPETPICSHLGVWVYVCTPCTWAWGCMSVKIKFSHQTKSLRILSRDACNLNQLCSVLLLFSVMAFWGDNSPEPVTSTLNSNLQGPTWCPGLRATLGWLQLFTPQGAGEWVGARGRLTNKTKQGEETSTNVHFEGQKKKKNNERTVASLVALFINSAVKCFSLFSSHTVQTINCTIKTILSHTEQCNINSSCLVQSTTLRLLRLAIYLQPH